MPHSISSHHQSSPASHQTPKLKKTQPNIPSSYQATRASSSTALHLTNSPPKPHHEPNKVGGRRQEVNLPNRTWHHASTLKTHVRPTRRASRKTIKAVVSVGNNAQRHSSSPAPSHISPGVSVFGDRGAPPGPRRSTRR